MSNAPRFHVEYVHRDGNRYALGQYHYLLVAQHVADAMRTYHPTILQSHLIVIVTDAQDEERGDLSDAECDDTLTETAARHPTCRACGCHLNS